MTCCRPVSWLPRTTNLPGSQLRRWSRALRRGETITACDVGTDERGGGDDGSRRQHVYAPSRFLGSDFRTVIKAEVVNTS